MDIFYGPLSVQNNRVWLYWFHNNNNNNNKTTTVFIVPKAEYYSYLQAVKLIN